MGWKKYKLKDLVDNFSIRARDYGGAEGLEFLGVSNEDGITTSKYAAEDKGEDYKIIEKGCFAYNPYRINVGSIGYLDDDIKGLISPAYVIFKTKKNSIHDELLFKFLKSAEGLRQIKFQGRGTVRQALRFEDLCKIEIFLPNYEEQFDLLEKIKLTENETLQLDKELTNQFSLVKQLRQAFLSEAMQGKLCLGQLPDKSGRVGEAETGQQLLARIKAEKAQLIKDKKLKKGKPTEQSLSLIEDVKLPPNWIWCKADDIFFITKLAGFEYSEYIKLKPFGDVPVIRAQNVRPLNILKTNLLYIDRSISDLLNRCALTKRSLLVTFIGAGIGDVATFDEDVRWHLAPNVAKMEPFENCDSLINVKFINYFLMSKLGQKEIFKHVKATAQPSLSMSTIRDIDLPIPPLSIQNQIVAKLDELMKTCDDLENSIKQSQIQNEQLLQQVLKEALEVREEVTIDTVLAQPKIVELNPVALNLDNLVAEPFEKYAAKPTNNIQNDDLEMALMIACMKNKLGVTYGDVGLQKNVYNTNNLYPVFSKQYQFVNSNFGTYSYELKEDLKKNPYLITQKVVGNKEVYTINPKYNSQILDKLTAPENKDFLQAINRMLSIYEHPFINKETDKIELYNTVLKLSLDKNTKDIEIIYQGMKDWKINQTKYKNKAEKFSKNDSKKMLSLLIDNGIIPEK